MIVMSADWGPFCQPHRRHYGHHQVVAGGTSIGYCAVSDQTTAARYPGPAGQHNSDFRHQLASCPPSSAAPFPVYDTFRFRFGSSPLGGACLDAMPSGGLAPAVNGECRYVVYTVYNSSEMGDGVWTT